MTAVSDRAAGAHAVVDRYWKWSAAAGLIPVPIVDVAAVTGIQLKMLSELAALYGVPFAQDRAKSIVGALVGALSPPIASGTVIGLVAAFFKIVPGVGMLAAVLLTSAFNAASTLAVGRVFVQHFESGGTFLDMDPDRVREHFRHEFEAARSRGSSPPAG